MKKHLDGTRSEGAARYSINAVTTAMDVFNCVVENGSVTLEAAAAAAGVSRSTAYRIVVTLVEIGLVQPGAYGGYQPGPTAYHWATKLLSQLDIRTLAAPTLQRVRAETGESVNLALLSDAELIYVEVLESPGILRTVEDPGSRVPIHAAASGKVVASLLPPEYLARLLGPEPYAKLGPGCITAWPDLRRDLEAVRARGFAFDIEEVAEGVVCVAAAIMINGRVAGALSVSGPRTRLTESRLLALGELVRNASEEVTKQVGPMP